MFIKTLLPVTEIGNSPNAELLGIYQVLNLKMKKKKKKAKHKVENEITHNPYTLK